MQSVAQVLFGVAVLVIQAALATLLPLVTFTPNVLLPIATYLGVHSEVHIVRGATVCFVLGYLLDAFCGNPIGLQTFVLVASFMLARGAGIRLFPEGVVLQALLVFAMALLAGGMTLALRAIFDPELDIGREMESSAYLLLKSGATTALISPVVLFGFRAVSALFERRTAERAP
jgi:rod shape-determining protein MreD